MTRHHQSLKAANCSYPHKVLVDDAMTMEGAVAHDHVCATYKNNYRNIANFQMSDVVPMDIDNDHSDNPADWITEDKMDELFGSIDYVLVPSRHHMLEKDGKSARPRSDLDKDPVLLNTPRATYNLEKGIAGEQPHDPFDLITKITECSPGDEGMDIWLEALETFFCGDTELIEYVQKVIGLAAIGKVYEEFIIIAYGDGANGKSTFWNTIARVLGTYSGKISSDILTMGNKVNAQPEMAELKGKRLIIASEMQEGVRLNTAMVKQLCSTDEIQACKKYKDPFHFVPSHQVVLYTNHLPKVGANDDGIWRRLKVIPFNAKIKGNSDIKNYADFLYEKAAPAIMKWIIEGAEKVSKTDHKVEDPKCVKDAVAAYRDDNDWLGHFLTDCCDVGKDLEEKSGEFYQQYRAYCRGSTDWTWCVPCDY